ncbi:hypothetical protein M0802_016831 [Mischocyttarus mexicanus]|nr:hypothetical protein M0802_016831 [Mischocyttarus mexicanus]
MIPASDKFGPLNSFSLNAEQGLGNYNSTRNTNSNKKVARPSPLPVFNVKAKEIIKLVTDNGINSVSYASINCQMLFRCVKCGKDHGLISKSNSCPVSKEDPKNKLSYANCGSTEHPDNYRGSPYLEIAHYSARRLKQLSDLLKQVKIRNAGKLVSPGISYASIANNQQKCFLPISRIKNSITNRDMTRSALVNVNSISDTMGRSAHMSQVTSSHYTTNNTTSDLEVLRIQF